MIRIVLAAALSLLAAEASAINRYQTTSMSCAKIKAAVNSEGAAILRWQSTRNPGLPLYGRYVKSRQYCDPSEEATFASVPAADTKSCSVRKCVPVDFLSTR
jgi:hypothetical protein